MTYIIIVLEILGTIAFSVSGAIEAMKKGMDMLGVLALGLVTAVGGGILRDMITGQLPPASLRNPRNAIIALVAALTAFVIGAVMSKTPQKHHSVIWNQALLVSDAIGLGAFTVLGIRCVQEEPGYENMALLIFVGVITGVGGGMLRDVFAGNVPYIFRKHVYATASIAGAFIYIIMDRKGYTEAAAVISLLFVLVLRLLAARYQWNLPKVHLHENA